MKAICTKRCPFEYGNCKTGVISVHPLLYRANELLVNEHGYCYCYNGSLLTIFDTICEQCGEPLEINRAEEDEIGRVNIFRCPICNKEVRMRES